MSIKWILSNKMNTSNIPGYGLTSSPSSTLMIGILGEITFVDISHIQIELIGSSGNSVNILSLRPALLNNKILFKRN